MKIINRIQKIIFLGALGIYLFDINYVKIVKLVTVQWY